jgi:oligopeptide/dipeptide ABC transporter ATP-binding protein
MTALAIMRLLPPPGRITGGEIVLDGVDLLRLEEGEMRARRGRDIAMIFQEPMTSLNPVLTVGAQIAEAVEIGGRRSVAAARAKRAAPGDAGADGPSAGGFGPQAGAAPSSRSDRVVELLRQVEMPDPERRAREYPHQLSGGMRQRVMIAAALAGTPRLLIADEPTTALDVTIQAQILDLLAGVRDRFGMALLLVTHDLGIVAERADHLAVMYAGRLVEMGTVAQVFARPRHPYTRGLLRSLPSLGENKGRLDAIPGIVPNLLALPSGCRFRDRCPLAVPACATVDPALEEIEAGHAVACIRAADSP